MTRAHAEYIKLMRSLHDERVFDMPPQTVQRYLVDKMTSLFTIWRFNQKCRRMPVGTQLRVEVLAPAVVRWSVDEWRTVADTPTRDTGLGVHVADLPTVAMPPEARVRFTVFWPEARRWEGRDFDVLVDGAAMP